MLPRQPPGLLPERLGFDICGRARPRGVWPVTFPAGVRTTPPCGAEQHVNRFRLCVFGQGKLPEPDKLGARGIGAAGLPERRGRSRSRRGILLRIGNAALLRCGGYPIERRPLRFDPAAGK